MVFQYTQVAICLELGSLGLSVLLASVGPDPLELRSNPKYRPRPGLVSEVKIDSV